MNSTMKSVRKGITPVVAIVLLLMLTVAVAGGVYAWINGMIGDQQDDVTSQLNSEITFRGVTCDAANNEVTFLAKNSGSTNIDTSDITLYLYDFSNGELLDTLSTSRANDIGPGDRTWGPTTEQFSNADMTSGRTYEIEFEFTNADISPVTKQCQAQ